MFSSLGDLFKAIRNLIPSDPYDKEAIAFERVETAYWWLTWNHAGQASWEYEALCKLSNVFRPGICSDGPEPDSMAEFALDNL